MQRMESGDSAVVSFLRYKWQHSENQKILKKTIQAKKKLYLINQIKNSAVFSNDV